MSFGEYLGAGAATTKLLLHLNGNSNDSSGNGLNGTDTNINYSKAYGKFNEGALFNGTNSKITLPISSILDFQMSSHTITVWIKVNGYPSVNPAGIIGKGSYVANTSYYITRISTKGKAQHLISSNADAQYDLFSSTDSLATGIWHCITFTWDKPNRSIKYYLNGSLKSGTMTNIGASLPVYQESKAAYVGANNLTGTYGFFNGNMDELIYENRIWSATEIQKYYTNALGRFAIL